MQKMSGFGIRVCLTEASLGWKCFGTYYKDREFYTFNDKNVCEFIRKSNKSGRVAALYRSFESNHYEEIPKTNKKYLKISDSKISNIVDEYLKFNKIKRDDFE